MCSTKNVRFSAHIYYCSHCDVPVITSLNDAEENRSLPKINEVTGKSTCPLCGGETQYLSTDLRPVFPQERLLLEVLLELEPLSLSQKSVWCENSRYYFDGKSTSIPSKVFLNADTDILKQKLEELKTQNERPEITDAFENQIERFVKANGSRLNALINEAHDFIKKEAAKFPTENIVLSFSGGKDSSVTADIVTKALSNPSLVHIFGNTTLEFSTTLEYAERFRKNHPFAIFETAINDEQDFMKVCDDIGPPARMMRWCCSMFKTGPITRTLNALYRNQKVLKKGKGKVFPSLKPPVAFSATPSSGDTPQRLDIFVIRIYENETPFTRFDQSLYDIAGYFMPCLRINSFRIMKNLVLPALMKKRLLFMLMHKKFG